LFFYPTYTSPSLTFTSRSYSPGEWRGVHMDCTPGRDSVRSAWPFLLSNFFAMFFSFFSLVSVSAPSYPPNLSFSFYLHTWPPLTIHTPLPISIHTRA
jgi:hypothetical protein